MMSISSFLFISIHIFVFFFSYLADLSIRYSCGCFCVHYFLLNPFFTVSIHRYVPSHAHFLLLFLLNFSLFNRYQLSFLISLPTSNISFYPENGFSSFNKFIFLLSFYLILIPIPIAIVNIFFICFLLPTLIFLLAFFSCFFFFQSSLIFSLLI